MAALVRASFVRDNWRTIDSLGPGEAARVKRRISDATRELVEGASRVAWLPVATDVDVTEAIDETVGRERMRRCMKDGLLAAVEGPLLSPFRRSVQAIFGITPSAYLRRAPRAFDAIYRDAGRFEISDRAETELVVWYRQIPPEIGASEAYVVGMAGALEAAMVLAGRPRGMVDATFTKGAREAAFVCRW